MPRARDHAFEALVEVTGANVAAERGALNAALKQIKEQVDGVEGEILADVIRDMAQRYRRLWPEMTLTPTALSKHWTRIRTEEEERVERDRQSAVAQEEAQREFAKRARRSTNRHAPDSDCRRCSGARMILVGYRPSEASTWQMERGLGKPHPAHTAPTDGHEIWGPCPECNPRAHSVAIEYRDRFRRIHG